MNKINWHTIDAIIKNALLEDLGTGDVTTRAMQEQIPDCRAKIIAREPGIVAGLHIAERAFKLHSENVQVEHLAKEGMPVETSHPLLSIHGPGNAILEVERTALNLMGRCAGIANATQQYMSAVVGTKAIILDTRKTAPLLREIDKYAVRAGGGQNHRTGLYDMILIKENHIRFAGGLEQALENALAFRQKSNPKLHIEIEVTNLDELKRAAAFPIERIMLDNFDLEHMRQAVAGIDGRIQLEASGGINLKTITGIAKTGVDFISVGALTHSVKNFDFSLLFE